MIRNDLSTLVFTIILFLFGSGLKAQESPVGQKTLTERPSFLKQKLNANDSLFLKDISIIKNFVVLDSLDEEMLKPQILMVILSDQHTLDTVITYQTLVTAVKTFKQGIGYPEFRKGLLLYKEMAAIIVNPENWEKDQLLFKRLGFTEADLEDFLLFISKSEHKKMNYKQAYLAYMREIDNLQ